MHIVEDLIIVNLTKKVVPIASPNKIFKNLTYDQRHEIVDIHLIFKLNTTKNAMFNVAKEFDVGRKTMWTIWKHGKVPIHLGKGEYDIKFRKASSAS